MTESTISVWHLCSEAALLNVVHYQGSDQHGTDDGTVLLHRLRHLGPNILRIFLHRGHYRIQEIHVHFHCTARNSQPASLLGWSRKSW